jgi:hypothetical protein
MRLGSAYLSGAGKPPTLHNTAEGIENGLGCEVLGGDQVDEVLLAGFLLRLMLTYCRCCGHAAVVRRCEAPPIA